LSVTATLLRARVHERAGACEKCDYDSEDNEVPFGHGVYPDSLF
jgi:hypothetical protein